MADFLKSATGAMKGAVANLGKKDDSAAKDGSQSARGSPRHASYGATASAPHSARPGHSAGPQYPEPEPLPENFGQKMWSRARAVTIGSKSSNASSNAASDPSGQPAQPAQPTTLAQKFANFTKIGKQAPPPPPPPPPPAPEQTGIAGFMEKAKQGTVNLGKKINDTAQQGMDRAQSAMREKAVEQAKADPKKAFTVVKALVKMGS